MKLEPLDAKFTHQTPRLACTFLALGRVDAGKGDQDVGICGAMLGDFFVVVPVKASLAFGINAKDYRTNVARAVIGGSLWHCRQHAVQSRGIAEIRCHARLKFIVAIVAVAITRLFGMGVKIDGDELI